MGRSVKTEGGTIETVFVDVGGTLWPNTWPLTPALRESRVGALDRALRVAPATTAGVLSAIVEDVDEGLAIAIEEPIEALIARVLAAHGFDGDAITARRVRQALCLNLGEHVTPFLGAGDLLRGIKDLGARSIILSNTTFRDAEIYGRDFAALGWSDWIDDCVTSVDVGCAKPDERMFNAALEASGSSPARCVMVGNSERADIAPAVRLGMRAVIVAIEEPPPLKTVANSSATRLIDVLDVLRAWQREAPRT